MADEDLSRSWRRTRDFLERACKALVIDPENVAELRQFAEYLESNELELACAELEAYAVQRLVDDESFWRSMKDACVSMALYERAAYYLDIATGHTKLDTEI